MKRSLHLLTGGLIAIGCLVTAVAAHARSDVSVSIQLGAPPAPIYEPVPVPRAGWAWVPGYWYASGPQYVWMTGHWYQPRLLAPRPAPVYHRPPGGDRHRHMSPPPPRYRDQHGPRGNGRRDRDDYRR